MRIQGLLAGAALLCLTALPASAQEAGRYEGALRTMITEAAEGRCAADVMGAQLLAACNQQIAAMSSGLAQLGPIRTVTFVRAEEVEGARYETYSVAFESYTMEWRIGDLKDGKFETAGTSGG